MALDPAALSLYLVTDRAFGRGAALVAKVEAAIAGGVTMVQYRDKQADTRELYDTARAILAVTRAAGIPLVINDRLDIALAIDAEGLHLGAHDLPLAEARLLFPGGIIGYSVERLEEIAIAERAGADYIGISAVFATPTKTDAGTAWGIAGTGEAAGKTRLPAVGIGGINETNAAAVLAAGPLAGVAVVSAILGADDPRAAAAHLAGIIRG
jgi:thiamine-phosphate pyrophosphorylase